MNTNSIEEAAETKKPEHLIEDIIWYYKSALNIEKTKEMFVPLVREWAKENYQQSQPVSDKTNSLIELYCPNCGKVEKVGITNNIVILPPPHTCFDQSQEQQPVSDKDIELKDFLVIMNEGQFSIWTKGQYESYVSKALEVGACPAVKLVTHFNNQDDLLAALNKQGSDAVEFGIWLNGKDYQSTPHFNKMRSVRQNEGKPVEISELYKLFKIETVQSQQEQPK